MIEELNPMSVPQGTSLHRPHSHGGPPAGERNRRMALRFFDTKPEAFALELAGTRSTYSGVCSAGRTGRNPHMCCAVYASLQLVAVHAEAYSRSNTNILHRRHARCA